MRFEGHYPNMGTIAVSQTSLQNLESRLRAMEGRLLAHRATDKLRQSNWPCSKTCRRIRMSCEVVLMSLLQSTKRARRRSPMLFVRPASSMKTRYPIELVSPSESNLLKACESFNIPLISQVLHIVTNVEVYCAEMGGFKEI